MRIKQVYIFFIRLPSRFPSEGGPGKASDHVGSCQATHLYLHLLSPDVWLPLSMGEPPHPAGPPIAASLAPHSVLQEAGLCRLYPSGPLAPSPPIEFGHWQVPAEGEKAGEA